MHVSNLYVNGKDRALHDVTVFGRTTLCSMMLSDVEFHCIFLIVLSNVFTPTRQTLDF